MVAAVATAWLLLWAAACAQSEQDFYDFKAVNIRGKLVSLEKYRGSVSDGPLRAWRRAGRGLQGPPSRGSAGMLLSVCHRSDTTPGIPARDPYIRRSQALAHSGLWLRGTAQEPPALTALCEAQDLTRKVKAHRSPLCLSQVEKKP